MNLEQFKLLTEKQRIEYGKTIPLGFTYDSNNNQSTYKDSNRFWSDYTYDSNNNNNNNLLTYKNSNGFWSEYTYDSNNNILTYKNSRGGIGITLIKGEEYTLWYDIDSKNYVAGCQNLSYKECLDFYKKTKVKYSDAELFMKTIKEHHKTIQE